jgi:ligand-binding sensor domain-containing protein
VNAITQTSDGYLWIATTDALVRFDGFTFQAVEQSNAATQLVSGFHTLLTDSEGTLWLEEESGRLLQYRDNAMIDALSKSRFPDARFTAIARTQDGGLVLATSTLDVFHCRGGRIEETGPASRPLPGVVPRSIAETSDGKIWIGSYEEGLAYEDRGLLTPVKTGALDNKINSLLPVANGGLWIGTDNGLNFWDGVKISSQGLVKPLNQVQVLALAKDRNSNIWVGTSSGLFRMKSGDPLSIETVPDEVGRAITVIFEDRDGSVTPMVSNACATEPFLLSRKQKASHRTVMARCTWMGRIVSGLLVRTANSIGLQTAGLKESRCRVSGMIRSILSLEVEMRCGLDSDKVD